MKADLPSEREPCPAAVLKRACFLRPDPNVTLNSAQGVFLGPARGRDLKLKMVSAQGFAERLPDGPRKD